MDKKFIYCDDESTAKKLATSLKLICCYNGTYVFMNTMDMCAFNFSNEDQKHITYGDMLLFNNN